ncbi:LysR family transcriptional regulator [Streptomyces violascens]|uniref:LysR family transcriptional regulator n=1 Tax=Streptomyces violascens TaxID=67381 RepID=UPI0036BB7695
MTDVYTWERLRVFAAVARHGSIRAAAESLHVTGPAVSQHIRKLEQEAGCKLLEPDGRGIRLTHAGRILSASAQQMDAVATHAMKDLAALSTLVAGPLRVGAVASVLRALVPQALLALTERYPRLLPELQDGEATDMLPALHTGELDAVVMESWTHSPSRIPPAVRTHPLAHEHALLAVSDRHPLAHLQEVPLNSLRGQIWTSCPAGSNAHQALVQLLRSVGLPHSTIRYCVADYTTQLQLVAAGLTVALIPQMAAPQDHPGVRLLRCRPSVTRTLSVATTWHTETPAVHAFVAEMIRTAHDRIPQADNADMSGGGC